MNSWQEIVLKLMSVIIFIILVAVLNKISLLKKTTLRLTSISLSIYCLIYFLLAYFFKIPFVLLSDGAITVEETINVSLLITVVFGIITLILIALKK